MGVGESVANGGEGLKRLKEVSQSPMTDNEYFMRHEALGGPYQRDQSSLGGCPVEEALETTTMAGLSRRSFSIHVGDHA